MSRSTWDTSRAARSFAYRPFTVYGESFQTLPLLLTIPYRGPATPPRMRDGLGCSRFARHYLGNLFFDFYSTGYLRCFTSPGVASTAYVFNRRCPAMTRDGFPHSEIPGSKRACRSPRLIAAYHVLHSLLMPRHSLCALKSLTINPGLYLRRESSITHLYAVVKEHSSSQVLPDLAIRDFPQKNEG